jgi:hypothetical protein
MLNKFFKTINNKYYRFFEFLFFLRYLFIISFISLAIFLTIPNFFNYEKKAKVIEKYLLENYNYELINYEKIKYSIFPTPNLVLTNSQIKLKTPVKNFFVKKIKIYPDFLSIYNYENFNSKKIILKDSIIESQVSNLKFSIKQLFFKEKKLYFDNLNVKLLDEKNSIFSINNIKFSNFGYNKNQIRGKIFNKKFKVKLDDSYKKINFKLAKSGINAQINLNEKQKENKIIGILKLKILNTNFKSNFEYDGKIIKLYNSYFRNKNLYFKNKIEIIFNPYLDINSNLTVVTFDSKILKKINFIKLQSFKDSLRKINIKSDIVFKLKKINQKFFDNFNLSLNLAYGRMNYSKRLSDLNDNIKCDGNINFLEEFPLLFFDCTLISNDKEKFLKKFSIRIKNKNEKLELKVKGNLSILTRKVNFKKVSIKDNYKSTKEDLKYFKESFENILFDESFLDIFELKKIKKFILEIS